MDKKKNSKTSKSDLSPSASSEKQLLPADGGQDDSLDSSTDFEIQFDFDESNLDEQEAELAQERDESLVEDIAINPIEAGPEQVRPESGRISFNEVSESPVQRPALLPFADFEEIFEGELRPLQEEPPSLFSSKQSQRSTNQPGMLDQSLNFQEALNLEGQVEALLFAAAKPLKATDIMEILQDDEEASLSLKDIEKTIQSLVRWYEERSGGFRLESVKGMGYQFQTVPAAASLMERLFSSRPRPLSRAALETLSIIAYRQPVTRADVEYVRGVDAGSIIKNLLDRSLIACVGRKEDSGRPMLFGTTDEFLKVFRLQALADLPPLSAFQPSADTISRAMEDLSEGEIDANEGVDVESFIADENQSQPDLSDGLTENDSAFLNAPYLAGSSAMTNDAGQDPTVEVEDPASERFDAGSEASMTLTAARTIKGAVFHDGEADYELNEQADDRGDWNDQGSKISVTDGSDLTPGSRKVDSGGSGRHKRRGDQATRDSD